MIPDTASFNTLLTIVLDDCADISIIPYRCATYFADFARRSDASFALLTNKELSWIRSLVDGEKISTIAARAGYSERSMFRHLARIYRILGASDRSEAMLAVRELGLCDHEAAVLRIAIRARLDDNGVCCVTDAKGTRRPLAGIV